MKKSRFLPALLLGLALLALGFLLHRAAPEARGPLRALPYLCLGVGCGLFGHGVGDLAAGRAAKADPELARRREIEARDERNVSIANQAKAKAYDLMTFAFGALLMFLALMNTDLAVVLVSVALYLFVECYAVWCRFKLEKEM